MQRAGKGDVVQVMSCGLGERAVLAPSGDSSVDQARVQRVEHVRPETEALHDARPEPLDHDVCHLDQAL